MKRHITISFILLLLSFIARILWDYFALPYRYIPWIGSLICAIYFLLSLRAGERQIKIRERKRDELKAQILGISDDTTLEDGDTVDELVGLCDLEELERVLTILKRMPEGERKLKTAFAELEQES
jgi:hypothetical protein